MAIRYSVRINRHFDGMEYKWGYNDSSYFKCRPNCLTVAINTDVFHFINLLRVVKHNVQDK